jgi:hypothetical protein
MKRPLWFLCALLFFPPTPLFAKMSKAQLLDTLTNREDGVLCFYHAEDKEAALRALLDNGDVTSEELSAALVEIAQTHSRATDFPEIGFRMFSIDSLGHFGTASALPFLETTLREDRGRDGTSAMFQMLNLSKKHPEALHRLSLIMRDANWACQFGNRSLMYTKIKNEFDHGSPSPEWTEHVCTFLLDATDYELDQAKRLDDLLCQIMPTFSDSPERLRFASRIAKLERSAGQDDSPFAIIETTLRAAGVEETEQEVRK